MLLGAHVSIAGGIYNAPYNGKKAACQVVQIFTKSSNQWRAKTLTDKDVEKFFEAQRETGVKVVCAHDSYLINLASPDEAVFEKSYKAFLEEMKRCRRLEIPYLVMHPGSHVGSGEDRGVKRVSEALNRLINDDPDGDVTICIETTAGQGTNLGNRFEQLAEIIDGIENQDRTAVCLDTCHIFAAGYPMNTKQDYNATLKEFDATVGLDRLSILHLNDSKKDFGSQVDRHEHIGQGLIGLEPFRFLMNDKRLARLPKILETPKKTPDDDIANLNILRSLIKKT